MNVDLSTISAATDVVLQRGNPLREIVDLNFRSGPDARLPSRLHLYSALLNHRYNVSVRTILVLLREKADPPTLDGKFSYTADNEGVEFRYRVIRLWEEQSETFLRGGVGTIPLAFLGEMKDKKPPLEKLRKIIRVIDARLQKEAEPAQAIQLMTATYILAGLRVDKNELKEIFAGVKTMPQSTAYDAMIEEGKIETIKDLLLRQGKKLFGPPLAALETELNAIQDYDRLDRLFEAILTAKSWEELLAIP